MSSNIDGQLARLAADLAMEPPEPEALSYRDLHPYATLLTAIGLRPLSDAFMRGLQDTISDRWESARVARLVAAAAGRPWSLLAAEAALGRLPVPKAVRDIALDLLIHAYLTSAA